MSDAPENYTLALLRKIDAKVDNLGDEMAGLRRSGMECHASAIGHGVLH